MSQVRVEDLVVRYGDTTAVDGIDFVAEDGELTTLVGPSGCGKTTTLRSIAGLERPDAGRITIGDEVVTDPAKDVFVPPHRRDIGFVFQTFDVWPHMTVFENVAYPLHNRDFPKADIEQQVMDTLALAGIESLHDKPSTQLSGGQQARVGICRAIVYEPEVLLFDEPLTGLDRNLRKQMRYEIQRIQSELGVTAIYVTHSQPEALMLSDKVALLNTNGTIEQLGTASDIYVHPQSQFAFDFFGSSITLAGAVSTEGVQTDIGDVSCTTNGLSPSTSVDVMVRPEHVELATDRRPDWDDTNTWHGEIVDVSFLGEMYEIAVSIEGVEIRSHRSELPQGATEGDPVYVHVDPARVHAYEVVS